MKRSTREGAAQENFNPVMWWSVMANCKRPHNCWFGQTFLTSFQSITTRAEELKKMPLGLRRKMGFKSYSLLSLNSLSYRIFESWGNMLGKKYARLPKNVSIFSDSLGRAFRLNREEGYQRLAMNSTFSLYLLFAALLLFYLGFCHSE